MNQSESPIFSIRTEHFNSPCNERFDDIVIAQTPASIYEGNKIIEPILDEKLRKLTKLCADLIDEHIHHADFIVTNNPVIVTEVVNKHCATCIAGNDQALSYLRENPEKELIVGRIWWALI